MHSLQMLNWQSAGKNKLKQKRNRNTKGLDLENCSVVRVLTTAPPHIHAYTVYLTYISMAQNKALYEDFNKHILVKS